MSEKQLNPRALDDETLERRRLILSFLLDQIEELHTAFVCEQERREEGEPLPEFGEPFSAPLTVVPFRPRRTPPDIAA